MKKIWTKFTVKQTQSAFVVLLSIIIIVILLFLPTGYEDAGATKTDGSKRVSAKVIAIDNSTIRQIGLVRSGEQLCTVELLQGNNKGEIHSATNVLSGSLEQDKIYEIGDKALVMLSYSENTVVTVSMIDHYRISYEIVLLLAFFLLLILFAGITGLRAILSFLMSVLMIWKILIPSCLNGSNPILFGAGITLFLTTMIIALVFGFDKRCLAACTGAFGGIIITCLLGILCTTTFNIQGAVMSFSESLLYSGYSHLNLTQIFMASIFIGSSGAVMDLTVDICAAVSEIAEKRPDLSRFELMKSGMTVGKAAMGTMSTTLLLAYSGGYIALLMVFMAQGTPLINVFNYKYVAAEIIHTLVGSFGLVSAAPLTALASGYFLGKSKVDSKDIVVEEISN